jgi:cytochrome c peroxidase
MNSLNAPAPEPPVMLESETPPLDRIIRGRWMHAVIKCADDAPQCAVDEQKETISIHPNVTRSTNARETNMIFDSQHLRKLALLILFFSTVLSSHAQLPEGSSLKMNAATGATLGVVELIDPGNHSWVLQGTTDFSEWANIEAWKVNNGRFQRAISSAGAPGARFFRVVFNPDQQTSPNTLSNALLLPGTLANYANPTLPPPFLQQPILGQDNTPANNPVTNAGATLGRVLFYDKRLSLNQTVSCSSCHQQANGFSDPRKFSVGFLGGQTGRNSMGLANARWYQRRAFFWDERAATLEAQVLQPIQNAVEMGMTLPALEARLTAEPYYQTLFTNAFGTPAVTSDRISRALAQFVRSIISTQTKFDAGVPVAFSNFTAQENQGRQIFNGVGNCTSCHGTDNFVPGPAINNNGLENPYVDKGVGALTGRPQDEGLFKVPSLRNIALTAPYMHDGRFATLEQVVEFYNSGVVNHPNLSPPLRIAPGNPGAGQPRRLNLTNAQKAALAAFLRTLTDNNLQTDQKFSDPFRYEN